MPELGAEAVGADQRRVARELPYARLRAGVDDRQAAPRSRQMFCGRSELGKLAEVAGGELVVVDDVQALAAIRAREAR